MLYRKHLKSHTVKHWASLSLAAPNFTLSWSLYLCSWQVHPPLCSGPKPWYCPSRLFQNPTPHSPVSVTPARFNYKYAQKSTSSHHPYCCFPGPSHPISNMDFCTDSNGLLILSCPLEPTPQPNTQSHFVKKQVSSQDSFGHFPSVAPISPKENTQFSKHYQSINFYSFATSGSKTSQILWLLTSTRRVLFFFLILTQQSFIDSNFHFNVAFYSLMFYTQFKVITSILFCQIIS